MFKRITVNLVYLVALQLSIGLCLYPDHGEPLKEADIKSGIIYHIANFSEWPKPTVEKDVFTVGFIGDSDVRGVSSTFSKLKIIGKPVRVRLYDEFDEEFDCDLLYIGEDQKANLSELLEKLKGSGVMTVSEIKSFALKGGCVGLVKRSSRFKFDVNLNSVHEEGLKVRSTLLKLANKVYRDE